MGGPGALMGSWGGLLERGGLFERGVGLIEDLRYIKDVSRNNIKGVG